MARQLERVDDRHIILSGSKAQSWWFDSSKEWLFDTQSWVAWQLENDGCIYPVLDGSKRCSILM